MKSALVYTVGSAAAKAIGFILLPLYSRALSPSQYGTLSVLTAVTALGSTTMTLGADFSLFRIWFELADDPQAQRRYQNSAWRFAIVAALALALALGASAWLVLGNGGRIPGGYVFLALLGAGLSVGAVNVPSALLRAQERRRGFLIVTFTSVGGVSTLGILLVVVLHMGVLGMLIAAIGSHLLAFTAACIVMPWQGQEPLELVSVRRSVRLGLPLLPHFISMQGLVLADRLLLTALVSASALGVYGLASNLAIPLMIAVQSLNQGFMPTYARAGTRPDGTLDLAGTVVLQVGIVVGLTVSAALLAPPLVTILTPRSYWGAGSVVGWIVLGYGFLGVYSIPMNGASLGAGRTRSAWIATLTSVVTNLALIRIFVPSGGIRAAAIASAAGYLVLLIGIALWAHGRGNPIRYDWRRIVPIVLAGAAVYALGRDVTPDHGLRGLVLRGAVVGAALGAGVLVAARDRRPHIAATRA